MTHDDQKRQLIKLMRERSLKRGYFTLASGATSSYYVDLRMTTMSGQGQVLIGSLGLALLTDAEWLNEAQWMFVGGLTLGADPVSYAIVNEGTRRGLLLDGFTVRKEAKDHGTGRLVEGVNLDDVSEVIIVEDVITTGGSVKRAIQAVEEEGASVIGVLAVLDRQEGGRKLLEDAGYPVVTILTATELLGEAPPPSQPATN